MIIKYIKYNIDSTLDEMEVDNKLTINFRWIPFCGINFYPMSNFSLIKQYIDNCIVVLFYKKVSLNDTTYKNVFYLTGIYIFIYLAVMYYVS